MLISGKLSWSIMMLIFSSIMLTILYLASKKIYIPRIRENPGIKAITEAIGRAVEMGRPVGFTPGCMDIYDSKYAADASAAMTILWHVAQEVIRTGAKLVVGIGKPTLLPLARELVKTAYMNAGRPEEFIEGETVRFLSPDQTAYTTAYVGMMFRENFATNFMFGCVGWESIVIAETGAAVGAMQVTGTTNVFQVPFLLVATDYAMIGEDVLATAAYLSSDPIQKGILFGQDITKFICIALIIIGSLLATIGNTFLKSWLSI